MVAVQRAFSRKGAGIAAIALVLLSTGYLAGRFGNVETLRAARNRWFARRPDPAGEVGRARSAAEMTAFLNNHLEEQYRLSSHWNRLLQTADPAAQRAIVEDLRTEFQQVVTPWPGPQTELNPQSEPWFQKDDVEVLLVRIQTHPGVNLLCVLFIPHQVAGPRPALLVLHGSGGTRDSLVSDIDYHHGFGLTLAREGFVVLAPLMVAWNLETDNTFSIKALASGWNYDAIELWQLVRAVDYLSSLQQVDPRYIGTYGISQGGLRALLLGAADRRFSLVLASGHFTNRFAWLFREKSYPYVRPDNPMLNIISAEATPLFGPAMAFLFDQLNLVALIQPRFFGVESGTQDRRHLGASVEFKKVEELYGHIGRPERIAFMPFTGGHEVSVDNVRFFLKKWVESPPVTEAGARSREP